MACPLSEIEAGSTRWPPTALKRLYSFLCRAPGKVFFQQLQSLSFAVFRSFLFINFNSYRSWRTDTGLGHLTALIFPHPIFEILAHSNMKFSAVILSTLVATALARPDANENESRAHARDVRRPYSAFVRPRWNVQLGRREVPQEHSHEKFLTTVGASLNLNNPDGIADAVFGLLGNGAAAKGLGSLTDPGMYFTRPRICLC
jgi:hypothetical protein